MTNKGTFFVAKIEVKANLSNLDLQKDGVINFALVGLPTTFNGVEYKKTLQHKLLVTNDNVLETTCINLRTESNEFGTLNHTGLVDKMLNTPQEIFDQIVSEPQLLTSVIGLDGITNKSVFNFFLEKENDKNILKAGIYIYPKI